MYHSLLSVAGPFWPRVVAPDRVLNMSQIGLWSFKQCEDKRLKTNRIIKNRIAACEWMTDVWLEC